MSKPVDLWAQTDVEIGRMLLARSEGFTVLRSQALLHVKQVAALRGDPTIEWDASLLSTRFLFPDGSRLVFQRSTHHDRHWKALRRGDRGWHTAAELTDASLGLELPAIPHPSERPPDKLTICPGCDEAVKLSDSEALGGVPMHPACAQRFRTGELAFCGSCKKPMRPPQATLRGQPTHTECFDREMALEELKRKETEGQRERIANAPDPPRSQARDAPPPEERETRHCDGCGSNFNRPVGSYGQRCECGRAWAAPRLLSEQEAAQHRIALHEGNAPCACGHNGLQHLAWVRALPMRVQSDLVYPCSVCGCDDFQRVPGGPVRGAVESPVGSQLDGPDQLTAPGVPGPNPRPVGTNANANTETSDGQSQGEGEGGGVSPDGPDPTRPSDIAAGSGESGPAADSSGSYSSPPASPSGTDGHRPAPSADGVSEPDPILSTGATEPSSSPPDPVPSAECKAEQQDWTHRCPAGCGLFSVDEFDAEHVHICPSCTERDLEPIEVPEPEPTPPPGQLCARCGSPATAHWYAEWVCKRHHDVCQACGEDPAVVLLNELKGDPDAPTRVCKTCLDKPSVRRRRKKKEPI